VYVDSDTSQLIDDTDVSALRRKLDQLLAATGGTVLARPARSARPGRACYPGP
jgi:hypothetical protein